MHPTCARILAHPAAALAAMVAAITFLACWNAPQLSATKITNHPATAVNAPASSVYLGQGCFWHTQYDFVLLELDKNGFFEGRTHEQVTSLVGYGGGTHQSPDGKVCYHGLPSTDYSKLGHSEAVSIQLTSPIPAGAEAGSSLNSTGYAQLLEVCQAYFSHGFYTSSSGDRLRLDQGDRGPEYRNVIGLPGGMRSAWFEAIRASNTYNMPLVEGTGSPPYGTDNQDDVVVYIHDSLKFPFFKGERYHQFHTNDVMKRPVPSSYTRDLAEAQETAGRLVSNCAELSSMVAGLLSMVLNCVFAGLLLLSLYRLYQLCIFHRRGGVVEYDGHVDHEEDEMTKPVSAVTVSVGPSTDDLELTLK